MQILQLSEAAFSFSDPHSLAYSQHIATNGIWFATFCDNITITTIYIMNVYVATQLKAEYTFFPQNQPQYDPNALFGLKIRGWGSLKGGVS